MPDFLTIKFNPNDVQKYRTALDRIDAVVEVQKSQLPYNCAVDYKNLVTRNILTQKYSNLYAPYSRRYAHWKTVVMMRGSQFWNLYGDLLRSISTFKTDGGWMGGVPAGAMDSGGKSWFGTRENPTGRSKPIAMYGRVMEFGMHTHPARPVFGPTADEYARGGYSIRARESIQKIAIAWR